MLPLLTLHLLDAIELRDATGEIVRVPIGSVCRLEKARS